MPGNFEYPKIIVVHCISVFTFTIYTFCFLHTSIICNDFDDINVKFEVHFYFGLPKWRKKGSVFLDAFAVGNNVMFIIFVENENEIVI